MGYLPHNAKSLLRGKIVYPIVSPTDDVLTWFGRDPWYEDKHEKWIAAGKPTDGEPVKTKFVKGFHRGLEFFGQRRSRLKEPGYRETIAELGLVVVEGPNDVVALDCLRVPAIGLCSNQATQDQIAKIADWARTLSSGKVTVMLDLDAEGESGAKELVYRLSERALVQLAWSPAMFGGRFKGRQPESLSSEEWGIIREAIVKRWGGVARATRQFVVVGR